MVAATIRMNKKKNIIREITQQNRAISCVFYRSDSTGKERDGETGYGYFGARYMDHELMTMWLSVDPMADKYPSISPYVYCAWNPVKLVDPDGTEPWYKLITGYNKNNSPNPPTATRKNPVTGEIRPHCGIDMAFTEGARINSAASGTVLFAGVKNGYGNTVVVNHGGGYYTLYAHMKTINVKTGDKVGNGGQLGEVGNTGIGTGPHLHVEYIKTDNPVNIFGKNKIACRYSPMAVEDLQNIVDRKEVQNVEFLDGHSEKLGGIEITPLRDCFFNPMPEPKASERLQESRLPIVKTLGDILKIVGL